MIKLVRKIAGHAVSWIIFPVVLIYLPYAHIYPLLRGEFTQYLGSIEVSYIQMSKFISASLPQFAWQPRWYLGYPMTVLYTPLIPFVQHWGHIFLGFSYGHGYRVLTALGYTGVLFGIYFFARALFKNSVAGFISALIYGICPSIIAFLYPEVAHDRFLEDIIEPRRFTILVRWGEGPHITSLVFLPLAALFFLKFLRDGKKWWLVLGAVLSALTVMTNSIGAWGLGILILAVIFGLTAENFQNWPVYAKRLLIFGLATYGLIAFWFNPLFLSTFFREGGGALGNWKNMFPWGVLMFAGILVVYFLLAKKLFKNLPGGATSIFFFTVMFWLVNTYYASGSERIELVPQVLRLTTEVDMAAGLVIGFLVSLLIGCFKKRALIRDSVMLGVLAVASIILLPVQFNLARELPGLTVPLEETDIKLEASAEYEVATTLESFVKDGERVFVGGNYSFFLNYFTDIPQLRGALYQSAVHPWAEHIYYQVVTGDDPEIALNLLKIANVGWLVVSGPRDIYQDFKYPEKFDQALEFMSQKNGDKYYRVPLKNPSLAKAVPKSISLAARPRNAIDEEPIVDYVKLLEQSENQLTFKEINNGSFEITGSTGSDELILIQQTYVAGWQAKDSSGQKLSVSADPLGFTLVTPKKPGQQDIQLKYRNPWSIIIFRLITIMTVLGLLILLIFQKHAVVKEPKISKNTDAKIDEEQ